ncbi:MAG: hypothetical protein HC806_10090 [Anaerolineae bacterium]|nr:hypothetical protein [Anaerolineae bacterium]
MPRKLFTFISLMLLIAALLIAGCAVGEQGPEGPLGPAGPAGPQGPAGPPGENASVRLDYVGSEKCGECHEEAYAKFILSGHPYKLVKIEDGQPPVYPYDNVTGGLDELPEGYTWADITYVIGGFGWKARFIGKDGFIITNPPGETGATDYLNQYNYANEFVDTDAGWVTYHSGEENLPYNCGTCHTTGYRPEGHQDDLEGIIGTWAFPGIQCEECHGPGNLHSADPYGHLMVLDRSNQLCGECHIRGDKAKIDAKGGFTQHHEQYEELYNSKHFATQCIACHDPHASSIYEDPDVNPNKGIRQTCDTCHWQQTYDNAKSHFSVSCTDCHMANTGKTAVGNLETFRGDISSHLFAINPTPTPHNIMKMARSLCLI